MAVADTNVLSALPATLPLLQQSIITCRQCPRLVAWREQVARDKRAAFRDQEYWGKPVPGFGDPKARLLVVGLAPAAHGGNRTGRIFTGDRSGDWLYGALHRAGFANQPHSAHRDDGMKLRDCWITACVHCAPPDNQPLPAERDACLPFLVRELQLLKRVRVILCLGGFAWAGALRALAEIGVRPAQRPLKKGTGPLRPSAHCLQNEGPERSGPLFQRAAKFGHAARVDLPPYRLIGCYHPSQQNTFTGRLTEQMLDDVMQMCRTGLANRPR